MSFPKKNCSSAASVADSLLWVNFCSRNVDRKTYSLNEFLPFFSTFAHQQQKTVSAYFAKMQKSKKRSS
jgi:hypothetical protein